MKVLVVLLAACSYTLALGQPIAWAFSSVAGSNGELHLELRATADPGWHIYATELPSEEGPVPTTFSFEPSDGFALDGVMLEPEPKEEYDPNFAMVVRYHGDTARFVQRISRRNADPFVVEGELEYMCCNDRTCLPPKRVPFSIPVAGAVPQPDR